MQGCQVSRLSFGIEVNLRRSHPLSHVSCVWSRSRVQWRPRPRPETTCEGQERRCLDII